MKPGAQMLLTILIVGAAFFAYDHLRARDATDPAREDAAAPVRPSGEAPTLAGNQSDSILARLDAVEGQLARMQREATSSRGAGLAPSSVGDPPPIVPEGARGSGPPRFDEKALATLAEYLKEIERRRARSSRAKQFESFLDRVQPDLSADERREVVQATLDYEQQVQQVMRDLGDEGNEQDPGTARQAQAAMERLYQAYRERLIETVGAGPASQLLRAGLVTDPRRASEDRR